jgi:hypothetical protein
MLEIDRSQIADVDLLRANGLIVYHTRELAHALTNFELVAPEVLVVMVSAHASGSVVPELRGLADHAASIIVSSVPEEREAARMAGADSFLPSSAPSTDLLFEVQRALILRRSGRRLPWNW